MIEFKKKKKTSRRKLEFFNLKIKKNKGITIKEGF